MMIAMCTTDTCYPAVGCIHEVAPLPARMGMAVPRMTPVSVGSALVQPVQSLDWSAREPSAGQMRNLLLSRSAW